MFQKHYSRDEARVLLPDIRRWLEQLYRLRGELEHSENRLAGLRVEGMDLGGSTVDIWVAAIADFRGLLAEFQKREILIKDLDRGLVDFPTIIGGKEAFLCWEQGEEDIGYWHAVDAGYAGREPL